MTRKEEIRQYLKERNIPITSLEANSIIEGIEWADVNPNKKLVYTKKELLDMGFGFDLNGNIRTPNECYESVIKYTEYRKQKLIDRGCEYLYLTLRNSYDEDGIHRVVSGNSLTEFIEGFKKYICSLK